MTQGFFSVALVLVLWGATAVAPGGEIGQLASQLVRPQEAPREQTAEAAGGDRRTIAVVATFSLCAADPEAGVCGAAVASRYPDVGRVVPYVRAEVGAFCTQHHHVPAWGPRALDLLAGGKSPQGVLAELLAGDPQPGLRQLGIVSAAGQTAQHNPTDAPSGSRYWGAQAGRYYACQGNTLAGREVITAMARAYEDAAGSLSDRLMAALVAGDAAGGDHRGRLAAGLRVAKRGVDGYWLELYTDQSADAVNDLWRKYVELSHEAKGD